MIYKPGAIIGFLKGYFLVTESSDTNMISIVYLNGPSVIDPNPYIGYKSNLDELITEIFCEEFEQRN